MHTFDHDLRRNRVLDDGLCIQRDHPIATGQPQHVMVDETLGVACAIAAQPLLAAVAIAAFVEHHFGIDSLDLALAKAGKVGDPQARDAANASDP